MFKGSRKYWFIAVFCGLAAAVLFYLYMQDIKETYRPADLVTVVKAKTDIQQDTVITGEQLETASVPQRYSHPEAVHNEKNIIGKMAISNINAGEEILAGRLLEAKDKASRLAYSIPAGKRAVAVPVDDIVGVAGFLKVGDRVDILATIEIPMVDESGMEESIPVTTVALQNIEVLAVGGNPETNIKKNNNGANTLTLAVSVQEARPLVLATEQGTIRLLLRSPTDHSEVLSQPCQLKDLIR